MILPIVAYGDPVLRKEAKPVTKDQKGLKELIENMWETMYNANGVGLAAPQINQSLNLFIVDTASFADEEEAPMKKVFINPEILEEWDEEWEYEEGCLSIPNIREKVTRHEMLRIRYQDEDFKWHEEEYGGMEARVIQHEYDHCKGVLFIDHISELKKRLLKNKLLAISKGGANVDYKMRLPALKR
jgi:peptide deformylase